VSDTISNSCDSDWCIHWREGDCTARYGIHVDEDGFCRTGDSGKRAPEPEAHK
jgi:hypothetical protein